MQNGEWSGLAWAVAVVVVVAQALLLGEIALTDTPPTPLQYNLTQFLIYDRNENGMVSVDETMNMLYARYGRASMELKLKQLFGVDMNETGLEGGEIPYSKFIEAVERVQMKTFWDSHRGKIVSQTNMGRMAKEELLSAKAK